MLVLSYDPLLPIEEEGIMGQELVMFAIYDRARESTYHFHTGAKNVNYLLITTAWQSLIPPNLGAAESDGIHIV